MQKDSQEENWQEWRQRDEQVQLTVFTVFGFPEICCSIKLSLMDKQRWLKRKEQNTAPQKERFQWKFRSRPLLDIESAQAAVCTPHSWTVNTVVWLRGIYII